MKKLKTNWYFIGGGHQLSTISTDGDLTQTDQKL